MFLCSFSILLSCMYHDQDCSAGNIDLLSAKLRSGSIFVDFVNSIPAGKAKRKESGPTFSGSR